MAINIHKNKTFENFDKLNLGEPNGFSERLESFLNVENRFVEEDQSLVVSLHAPFGYGKSTFIEMWQNSLQERRKKDKGLPLPVYVNAWESDYHGDPFLPIITAIIDTLSGRHKKTKQNLKDAAENLTCFLTGLGSSFMAHWTGIYITGATDYAENQSESKKVNFIETYKDRTKALDDFKSVLKAWVQKKSKNKDTSQHPKAYIVIDELDRCRPDYAIHYLETIKHIFDVPGLVFILAVNEKQLETSAKALFGERLDFPEYYRKFVQRSVPLPEINTKKLERLNEGYIEQYLERADVRKILVKDATTVEDFKALILPLFMGLGLIPRQIKSIFRIVGHVMCGHPEKNNVSFTPNYLFGVVFLAALKESNAVYEFPNVDAKPSSVYHAIGKRQLTVSKFLEFLLNKITDKNDINIARRWFELYATGVLKLHDEIPPNSAQEYARNFNLNGLNTWLGAGKPEQGDFAERLADVSKSWNTRQGAPIINLYNMIEGVESFASD